MPIESTTCYVLRCDTCGDDCEGEYVPHWPSEEMAQAQAREMGWEIDEKGRATCEECLLKAEMAKPQ